MFKKVLLLIFLISALAVAYFLSRESQILTKKATGSEIFLSLVPSQATLPAIVKVFVDPKGDRLEFVRAVIIFPADQLSLDQEPQLSGNFPNVIKLSTAAEANAGGKIEIIAGANPLGTPLTTSIELASLKFVAKVASVDPASNNVTFDRSQIQVTASPHKTLSPTTNGVKLRTSSTPPPPPPSDSNCALTVTPTTVSSSSRHRLEAKAFAQTAAAVNYSWSVTSSSSDRGKLSSAGPYAVVLWTAPAAPAPGQSWKFTAVARTSTGKTATCTTTLSY